MDVLFPLILRIFEHLGETVWGLLQPPFVEQGVTGHAKNEMLGPSGPPLCT